MGGMQRHSANLAKYLTLNGVQVTLVHCVPFGAKVPSDKEVNQSLFGEKSSDHLYRIISLQFPKHGRIPGHYVRNSYRYSQDVYKQLSNFKFDFIYAKGYTAWEFIRQKKKGNVNVPIGVKFHGYEMFQIAPSTKQKIDSLILKKPTLWNNRNADYVFSYGGQISEIIKRIGVSENKIIEYTSGIDNHKVRNSIGSSTDGPIKFVYLGRVERRKGILEIFEALGKLLKSDLQFEFHFVGPIEKNQDLIDNRIVYHGSIDSIDEILNTLDQMDVLVCPSHSEGMPNVIIEGMARGLAILTTKVGAIEEIVSLDNGVFVQPANVKDLENALRAFCNIEHIELESKKLASLDKVKSDLTWDQISMKMIQSIEQIISGKS